MPHETDIAVIGGGASGLTAAIFAAEWAGASTKRIVVLDSARSLGAKILVSGGGRCNVTHDVVKPEDFNGSRPVVRNILAAFDVQAAVRWFSSMGVELKLEETGKLFPVANTARAVLEALLRRCRELGIVIQTSSRVGAIRAPTDREEHFQIEHTGGTLAHRVILAAGGRSLPLSGSDGSGWEIVKRLGHSVTQTCAALVPLRLDARMFHAGLSGISMPAELSTFVNGKPIDRRTGNLLWTHFGISGPVVMDASRYWVMAHESGAQPTMQCNLLPPDGFEAVERWLVESGKSRGRSAVAKVIAERMPERVAAALVAHATIDAAMTCGQLSRDDRRALVHRLTALPLPILGHRGWNYAEVTAGGVPLSEIDYRTMASRKIPGLFLVGELLDCDGRIGGFNFQWAWATGYLAGKSAGGE